MLYLTSTDQNVIIAAEAQISLNANLPNNMGTTRWAAVQKALNEDLWFIEKPSVDGWGNFGNFYTQVQLMNNVDMTHIIEQGRNDAWFPVPLGAG